MACFLHTDFFWFFMKKSVVSQRRKPLGLEENLWVHKIMQAFLYAFEKTQPWKKHKKPAQEKNLSQILPNNSTYCCFFFTKKSQKTSCMKKTGTFVPKTQFFPLKNSMHRRLQAPVLCHESHRNVIFGFIIFTSSSKFSPVFTGKVTYNVVLSIHVLLRRVFFRRPSRLKSDF